MERSARFDSSRNGIYDTTHLLRRISDRKFAVLGTSGSTCNTHAITCGFNVWLIYILLGKAVARPMHDLCLKLYTMTRGDRRPVVVNSYFSDIQIMADGINHLLVKPGRSLKFSSPPKPPDEAVIEDEADGATEVEKTTM